LCGEGLAGDTIPVLRGVAACVGTNLLVPTFSTFSTFPTFPNSTDFSSTFASRPNFGVDASKVWNFPAQLSHQPHLFPQPGAQHAGVLVPGASPVSNTDAAFDWLRSAELAVVDQ
jgi:hypothetical protein